MLGARASVDRELVVAVAIEAQRVRTRERVEHELTREAEQVERGGAVVVQERSRREEVLAQRDLGRVGGAVRRVAMQRGRALDRVERAWCPRWRRSTRAGTAPGPGVEVGLQPVGRLHDVRVGVVHRSSRVGHAPTVIQPGRIRPRLGLEPGCAGRVL